MEITTKVTICIGISLAGIMLSLVGNVDCSKAVDKILCNVYASDLFPIGFCIATIGIVILALVIKLTPGDKKESVSN